MSTLFRIVSVLIAAIALATPITASAQGSSSAATTSTPPVQIEDCKAGKTGNAFISQSDGSFQISFTNESKTTADVVRFRIDYGQERLFIRDAGTFSPGITIAHKYYRRGNDVVSSPLLAPAKLQCTVAAVHFADGTEWNPSTAAATNNSPQLLGNGWLGTELQQQNDGVVVDLVFPGSPADVAGFHQGDRIVSIQTNTITSPKEVIPLVSAAPVGTKLGVVVIRNGQQLELTPVVAARPQAVPGA